MNKANLIVVAVFAIGSFFLALRERHLNANDHRVPPVVVDSTARRDSTR